MSKADEMFKELGFKQLKYENYISFESENREIEFDIKEKSISVACKEDGFYAYFDMQELQAINKKCKELGWLDE